MDRNIASILALAGTAAISVTLAAIAPSDAYADALAAPEAQPRYTLLGSAGSPSIEELKDLYLQCDRASVERRLTHGEVMVCSTVYEVLKHRAFDGDFERLLAWSRASTPQRLGTQ